MSCTKNLRDAELEIQSDTNVTVVLDEGDLRFTVHRNKINILDRGTLSHMRKGDEQPVDVSWTCKFIDFGIQSGATSSVYDILTQTGTASAYTGTNTDEGDVYTTDLVFTITAPDAGTEVVTFTLFAIDTIEFAEGDEYNTLTVTGTAFITEPSIV